MPLEMVVAHTNSFLEVYTYSHYSARPAAKKALYEIGNSDFQGYIRLEKWRKHELPHMYLYLPVLYTILKHLQEYSRRRSAVLPTSIIKGVHDFNRAEVANINHVLLCRIE